MGWSDFVTWLLLVLGWYVIHRCALERDRKNTRLSQFDDAVAKVEDIEEAAIRYWRCPGVDMNEQGLQRGLMIMKIDHLEGWLSMISENGVSFDSEINNFQNAILDEDGESLERSALQPGDARLNRILDAANGLKTELRRAR